MKFHLIPASAAVMLALLVTGCEIDGGLSARKQEKSEAYAAARTWQKSFMEKGVVANGFTPDMVYIALGKPSKIETKELPEGHIELWTYRQYYPTVDAIHGFRNASFTTESAYQPQRPTERDNTNSFRGLGNQPGPPIGQGEVGTGGGSGAAEPQSIGLTGGAQGGSMEPSDLRSYTIRVMFASGKVIQIGAIENVQ